MHTLQPQPGHRSLLISIAGITTEYSVPYSTAPAVVVTVMGRARREREAIPFSEIDEKIC